MCFYHLGVALVRSILSFGSFVVLREIWPVSPLGEISVFYTGYQCVSDGYHLDITFVWFVSIFVFSAVFEKCGQLRWFLRLPVFRIFEKLEFWLHIFVAFIMIYMMDENIIYFHFSLFFTGIGSGKFRFGLFPILAASFVLFDPNLLFSLVAIFVDPSGTHWLIYFRF